VTAAAGTAEITPVRTPEATPGERCLVMGVLNVTPDSFSDGGRFLDHARAVERGVQMAADGADIVDVGGESTRPGAQRVSGEEERRRVLPVVNQLAAEGVTVSVDTMRAQVARAAVQRGARMVNDVSGGLADPAMAACVARTGVAYVAMHWRAHSAGMRDHAVYDDVVTDVAHELRQRLDALTDAGVDPGQVVLDPGLGFAKTAEHSWSLLANLDALHTLGRPLLIGASRKSFLGPALADGGDAPPAARDDATLAVSALAAAEGAHCVRVHEVRCTVDAVRSVARWRAARAPGRAAGIATHGDQPPRGNDPAP
jgi:dihydropteroate synthase